MTFAKTSRTFAVLLGAALVVSCEKNAVQDITGPIASSRIKFFNFGANAPSVNFYANDTKMTAITSTTGIEAVTGVAFGGVGSGGLYSSITPGQYAFKAKIAAATDKDLTITTVNSTIADGKFYSFYVSGLYDAAAKTVEGFVVEDAYPPTIDFSVATVRFVNAISNSQAQTLYARNTVTMTETAVGGAIAYKSAGAFVTLPPGVYDLSTRYTGSSANVIVRTLVSFNGGRTYTTTARGDITVTLTSAATRPQLDNTTNR